MPALSRTFQLMLRGHNKIFWLVWTMAVPCLLQASRLPPPAGLPAPPGPWVGWGLAVGWGHKGTAVQREASFLAGFVVGFAGQSQAGGLPGGCGGAIVATVTVGSCSQQPGGTALETLWLGPEDLQWQPHHGLGNDRGWAGQCQHPAGTGRWQGWQLAGLPHHGRAHCAIQLQMWGKLWGASVPLQCAPSMTRMKVSPGPCSHVPSILDTWQRCPAPHRGATRCHDTPVCARGVRLCTYRRCWDIPGDAACRGRSRAGLITQP